MLGGRMDIPVGIEIDGIYNLAGRLKMTDSVALLTFCDLVITPDSSLVHFAAALDVPCLSIYGPFPASVRTSYYPKNVSLEPPDEPDKCWPCFCHERVCPKAEERTYISPCLHRNKISSDTVSNTALGMLGRSVPIETGITTGINSDINKRSVSGMHETVYC
jgi:heptosyltransferase-2